MDGKNLFHQGLIYHIHAFETIDKKLLQKCLKNDLADTFRWVFSLLKPYQRIKCVCINTKILKGRAPMLIMKNILLSISETILLLEFRVDAEWVNTP
jgi:hypothetical protein